MSEAPLRRGSHTERSVTALRYCHTLLYILERLPLRRHECAEEEGWELEKQKRTSHKRLFDASQFFVLFFFLVFRRDVDWP